MNETIDTIIWDLDNTLYKFTDDQVAGWNNTTARYVTESGLDVPFDTAVTLAEQGWFNHRDSAHHFVQEHGFTRRDIHIGVNKLLCETTAQPCLETPALLRRLGARRNVILTYATRDWALRVLNHTGLSEFFDDSVVFGAENYNFEDKAHSPRGIQTVLDKMGGNAGTTLFVEDTLPNLVTAKIHTGICTAYLHHNRPMNDNVAMQHIDVVAQDTPNLLKKWFKVAPTV